MIDESLSENLDQQDMSLSEYEETAEPSIVKTDDSKNLAAQLAIENPEGNALEKFNDLSSLDQESLNETARRLQEKSLTEETDAVANTAVNMAISGDIEEESLSDVFMSMTKSQVVKRDSMVRMAEKMNTSVSAEETVGEFEDLLQAGTVLDSMVDLQKELQKAYNQLYIGNDGKKISLTNNLGDTLEALIPFAEQVFLLNAREALLNEDVSAFRDALYFGLQGEGKVFSKDKWDNATIDQKIALAKVLPSLIEEVRGLVFTNDNELLKLDAVMTMTKEGYYGNFDRFLDNLVSILDVSGIGIPLGKGIASATRAARLAKLERRTYKARKQPASPRSVAEQANPEKAAELHAVEMADNTDNTAKVVSGTTRTEAAVDAVSPQVRVEDGSVEAIPFAMDKDILDSVTDEYGGIVKTSGEIEATAVKIEKHLADIQGLKVEPNLSTAPEALENGKIQIDQVFSKGTGSFKTPEEAINTTMRLLSDYGIAEENLELLRKVGNEYVPTTKEEVLGLKEARQAFVKKKKKMPEELKLVNLQDNYAVRVKAEHEPTAFQVVWEDQPVSRLNFFERAPTSIEKGKSTITRWFVPPQALLSERTTGAASSAVDQSNRVHKVLAEKADETLRAFDSLKNTEQQLVDQLLFEQVLQKRYFPKDELIEEGLSSDAIKVMEMWKNNNDQYWHLSNFDLVTAFKNRGFSLYVDKPNGKSLLAKPLSVQSAGKAGKVYDPDTKTFKTLTQEELKDLYESGGTVSKFRRAEDFDGVEVAHILVKGSDSGRHIRGLKTGDKLLSYKPGHSFTVRYKDPYFIETFKRGENGEIIQDSVRAIFTAPNKKQAMAAIERLKTSDTYKGFELRERANRDLNLDETIDARFDIAESTGLVSQRKRGETIPQYRSGDADLQYSIQSPIESLKVTMRELSNRIPMRKYLDDLEAQWFAQYGKVANTEKNIFGRQAMPTSTKDFKSKADSGLTDKQYADAKSTLEFYNMMKFGYHNSLDRGWRKSLNWLGDFIGSKSSWLEGFFRGLSEEIPSPVGALRGLAFNQWIAASMPSSQWLVQSAPAIANAFLHPKYVWSGGMAKDMSLLTTGLIIRNDKNFATKASSDALKSLMPKGMYDEAMRLVKEWDATGLGAGIDKHLIVENGLDHLIESQRFKLGKATYNETFNRLRAAGFDVGEFLNLSAYWLGTRNDAIKANKNLSDKRVLNEIREKTRNLTLNMNKAGEMPWNKNSLSLITQFLISPYKGLTVFLNKGLSAQEKWTLGLWNVLGMPMPAYFSYTLRTNFDLDEELGEVVSNGIAGGMINIASKAIFEGNTSISFTRLNQLDPTMPWELVHGIMTEPLGAIVSASPSLSSMFGHNPVLATLVQNTRKVVTSPFKDLTEKEQAEQMEAFVNSLLNSTALGRSLSTGWRELWIAEYDKRYNSLGYEAREGLTTPESFAKTFFGLNTTLETLSFQASRDLYYKSEEARKDIMAYHTELSRLAKDSGYNIDDPGREEFIMRHFMSAFPEGELPQELSKMFSNLLASSYKKGEAPISTKVLKASKWLGTEEAYKVANALKDLSPEAADAFEYIRSEKTIKEMKEFMNE